LGLDVVVDKDGKELLQYVAPQQFARLREPLVAAGWKSRRAERGMLAPYLLKLPVFQLTSFCGAINGYRTHPLHHQT
jgi:hypothetical protein